MEVKADQPLAAASTAAVDHPLLSRRYQTWLVAMLLIVSALNVADRSILAILAQPIKEDLKLTDTDLGMLQGLGFAIFYSVLGLPLGWLAERVSRKNLIGVCLAAWSAMTMVCGLATNFSTLLLARVGLSIGEAGFLPANSSLVADHFKPDRRGSILAIIALGGPFGFLFGQAVGGWVAAEWNWRVAFVALGAPGLLVALVVGLTLREPPRGLAEGQVTTDAPPSMMAVVRYLWSKPAFRHLLFGLTLTNLALNAVAQFVLPFYLRSFALPLAVAGAVFGAVTFGSTAVGNLLGGFGFDRLSRRDVRWSLWGPAGAVVLGAPVYLAAFASTHSWTSIALIGIANLVVITHFAPTAATMQNLVGPRMRASTAALVALTSGLLGAGLGPTVVGVASDLFASQAFAAGDFISSCPGGRAPAGGPEALDAACRGASVQGLRQALMAMQVFFVWASIHYLLAARTLKQDLYRPPSS
jgi:MFS family permease